MARCRDQSGRAEWPDRSGRSGQAAWQEGGKQLRDGAKWAEDNYGELASSVWEEVSAETVTYEM